MASVSSTSCIPNGIPETLSTEVVFQNNVPTVSKFDVFASVTNNQHEAFCFRQVSLWFLEAAWPTFVPKYGFAVFSFLLEELGR